MVRARLRDMDILKLDFIQLTWQVRNGEPESGAKQEARCDASAPRGAFTLGPGDRPVVLLSGGVGATPVLAMLHAQAADDSMREVWWLHGARRRLAALARLAQFTVRSGTWHAAHDPQWGLLASPSAEKRTGMFRLHVPLHHSSTPL